MSVPLPKYLSTYVPTYLVHMYLGRHHDPHDPRLCAVCFYRQERLAVGVRKGNCCTSQAFILKQFFVAEEGLLDVHGIEIDSTTVFQGKALVGG